MNSRTSKESMTHPAHDGSPCPFCIAAAKGETIDLDSWLPPVPTDTDLSKVLSDVRAFVAATPGAQVTKTQRHPLIIWTASGNRDTDMEVTRYWAIAVDTLVYLGDLWDLDSLVTDPTPRLPIESA